MVLRPLLLAAPLLAPLTCAMPAHADDCAPVKAAMLGALRTPHTAIITRQKDGKPSEIRMIQTRDSRYFEIRGQWRSVPLDADDLAEMEKGLDEAKIACRRLGAEQLEGKAVTVYAAHVEKEDSVSDNTLWIGSNGLPLRVETVLEGQTHSTLLDYGHADPPAGAAELLLSENTFYRT
ncbi:hypothetical protein [Roseicella frigidaeris]|uniref:Uncharacterized protein n=1 Tax=Roseicella frigidaeris TaxID=2230885 RepID=A0A327LXL2_9PROT|nr:hypothetical protein [Roseicella frigidaeris]RAI54665.1 hypothetical protein DOO78_25470 [Roseicella frigidaeris]